MSHKYFKHFALYAAGAVCCMLAFQACTSQNAGKPTVYVIGDATVQADAAQANRQGNNAQRNNQQRQGQPGAQAQGQRQGQAGPQGQRQGQGGPQGQGQRQWQGQGQPQGQPGAQPQGQRQSQGGPQGQGRPQGQGQRQGQGGPQGQGQRQWQGQGQPQGQPQPQAEPAAGWGGYFAATIDSEKAAARVMAGNFSSRSFYENQWANLKNNLTKGDIILIQFSAADNLDIVPAQGARIAGSLPGTGSETKNVTQGQEEVTVHTYGWYLQQMVKEAKAKGATAVVCSPVPANKWEGGKVVRSSDYAGWAKEAAAQSGAKFLDLNELVAQAYEQIGQEATNALFTGNSTNAKGAVKTARTVYDAVSGISGLNLAKYLRTPFPTMEELEQLRARLTARKPITANLIQSAEAKKKYKKLPANVPARQMEKLNRGTVAILQDDGKVFISWRLVATDPDDIAFNIYRRTDGGDAQKLNSAPISDVSWFIDAAADTARTNSWFVTSVIGQEESQGDKPFTIAAHSKPQNYLSIPLQTLEGYSPGDCSAADLDGDGEYEIVVKMTHREYDNSQSGVCTGTTKLEAYKLDGTFMWRIDLGPNIREGAHYTQFQVYDFDGDGKAEVICKTSEGTTDGTGMTIGDTDGDGITNYVNQSGYILDGPEFFSVFEGTTGKELARENYIARGPKEDWNKIWGDTYGNRIDRYLAGIGYFDGERPSVLLCRGYYTRAVLEAWNWRDGKLTRVWRFDSDDENTPDGRKYRGQGNHNLSIADVDNDGKDEVIYGACCIDHDGTGYYTTQIGHGDAIHVGDLDPDRPGLEVFQPHESAPSEYGIEFRDARTGESLWGAPSTGDVGRGVAFDIDPRYRGSECWGAGQALYSAKGEKISDRTPSSMNFGIWWDGDLLRELLDRNTISKWDWENTTTKPVLVAENCRSNNGTKATPNLSCDILGDWREELILATNDNKELRVFTTTIPTEYRFYTFMHDFVYRPGIAWQNTAYNQPPHESFFVGDGVKAQPKNKIYYAE